LEPRFLFEADEVLTF